jgi:3-oxoacid CoA-transferase A subunit
MTGQSKLVGVEAAVEGIESGMTVMLGGWGILGTAPAVIAELARRPVRDLTVIMLGSQGSDPLHQVGAVRRMITSFGSYPGRFGQTLALEARTQAGEVEVELCSQGVLAERIRAGGAGIPAFYVEERVVGVFRSTDETREIDGKRCVLETALWADVALLGATIADRSGNLAWADGERNINEVMAYAADLVIVEATELYEVGWLAPEHVMVPGLVVDRVVVAGQ